MNYRTNTFIDCRDEAFEIEDIMPKQCLKVLEKHYGKMLERKSVRVIDKYIQQLMFECTGYYFSESSEDEAIKYYRKIRADRKNNFTKKGTSSLFERAKTEALGQYPLDYKTCMEIIIETYDGHIHNIKIETLVNMIYEMMAIKYNHLLTCEIVEHVKQCLKGLEILNEMED